MSTLPVGFCYCSWCVPLPPRGVDLWARRHDRATLGRAYCCARHLPRSRALISQPFRQSQRLALALHDAAGPHPVGRTGLGVALPSCDCYYPLASGWYGERNRQVEVSSATGVWYHSGIPTIPLRWVLIRDPLGQFETQALSCTDRQATPAFILECFVPRWQVDVTCMQNRSPPSLTPSNSDQLKCSRKPLIF